MSLTETGQYSNGRKIKVLIIDDDEEAIFNLKEHLSFFPEIETKGSASKFRNIRSLLKNEEFDLLFLDIDMPGNDGFEMLHELRQRQTNHFSVIFYTAYAQYAIQAIRESAFDYILKPAAREDLKNAIERYKSQVDSIAPKIIPDEKTTVSESISLPAPIGLKFLDKNNILMFQCTAGKLIGKKSWIAVLTDCSRIKLRYGTSAKDILEFAGSSKFMQLNQSLIVNINYLSDIEFKTRICHLVPPFNEIQIVASRANMAEIRKKFDLL
jgi:two-component system LytT family response regulator